MKKFVFTLENIQENLVLPTAIVLGYQPKIMQEKEETKTFKVTRKKYNEGDYTLPEGVSIPEEFITGDKKDVTPITVDYTVKTTEEIDNPMSVEDFYHKVMFKEKFIDKIIAPAAVKAATMLKREEIAQKEEELKELETTTKESLKDTVITTGKLE